MTSRIAACLAALLLVIPAGAHVGSPDTYLDGMAGPYQVSVIIRPPVVIPGLAEMELRTPSDAVDGVHATVLMMAGAGSQQAPSPETLTPDPKEAHCWRGHIWFMVEGTLRMRFTISGKMGSGTLELPVASAATATAPMSSLVKVVLSVLGSLLVIGVVAIVGMANGEALLAAGQNLAPAQSRKKRQAQAVALISVAGLLFGGRLWWNNQQARAEQSLYRPASMQAKLNGSLLTLTLGKSGWYQTRSLDAFLPDHNHLMHLYVVRWPQTDVALHLHPDLAAPGVFSQTLPEMPAGNYRLFGDIVHADGYPETLTAALSLPALRAGRLQGDDAIGYASPFVEQWMSRSPLANGNEMVLMNAATPVSAGTRTDWRVEIQDAHGKPLNDILPYMGMLGHAAFLDADGTTFAHTHPTGTVSMAAFNLLKAGDTGTAPDMKMDMSGGGLTTVTFPYGLPKRGWYRLIVQMRRPNGIETGFFNVQAR